MKLNITAFWIAIIYNLINGLFLIHLLKMPNATSMIYLFIYPVFWIITFILVAILIKHNKMYWFQKEYKYSTIISLLFCTPIPFLLAIFLATPDTFIVSTNYSSRGGYTFKSETLLYRSTKSLDVIKYWKAHKEDCDLCDSSYYMRDSTWTYFDKNKDTIKVETYKNGKLINIKTKFEKSFAK